MCEEGEVMKEEKKKKKRGTKGGREGRRRKEQWGQTEKNTERHTDVVKRCRMKNLLQHNSGLP